MHLLIITAATALSPPIQTVSAPPPPGPLPIIVSNRAPARTLTFGVTIKHGDAKLWEGRLAMASNGNASLNQRREQTIACPDLAARGGIGRFSTGFSLSLSGVYGSEAYSAVRMSARLDRPTTDGPLTNLCADQGVRSVEVQSTFVPVDGKAVTIDGDAGFSVTLIPRFDGG